jgi:hypothetical protein
MEIGRKESDNAEGEGREENGSSSVYRGRDGAGGEDEGREEVEGIEEEVSVTDSRVRELHRVAMWLAEEAATLRREFSGSPEGRLGAISLDDAAYMVERTAADLCTVEPSRSVLYRSAATLALDADERQEAGRLARLGLLGNPPPEIADELREVLKKCDGVAQ